MIRKIGLVIAAVCISYGFALLSGYLLYSFARGQSEITLSALIKYAISPAIAVLVGLFVGYLAEEYAFVLTVVGLMPWVLPLHGRLAIASGWFFSMVPPAIYLLLGGLVAHFVSRFRKGERRESPNRGLAR